MLITPTGADANAVLASSMTSPSWVDATMRSTFSTPPDDRQHRTFGLRTRPDANRMEIK